MHFCQSRMVSQNQSNSIISLLFAFNKSALFIVLTISKRREDFWIYHFVLYIYIYIYIYTYIYIYIFINYIYYTYNIYTFIYIYIISIYMNRLPHPTSRHGRVQETFLAPSVDKPTSAMRQSAQNIIPTINIRQRNGATVYDMMSYISKFTNKYYSPTVSSLERRQPGPGNVFRTLERTNKQRNISQSKIHFQYLCFSNAHTHYSKGFHVLKCRVISMETLSLVMQWI